ncbi:TPA: hypothetical protein ACPJ0H_002718 [Vibrio diabolicus]
MNKIIAMFSLTLLIPLPSLANFAGFTEKSYSNGQYLRTHFTQTDRSQFHIGCGRGSDHKAFSFVGVKHPSLYHWNGDINLDLSVDRGKTLPIKGGSNRYDDMFYSSDSATSLIQEMLLGKSLEVRMLDGDQKMYFSLKGIEEAYTTLKDKCDLSEN